MTIEALDRSALAARLAAHAGDATLSVAAIDVDGFAAINGAHGPEVGDGVLALVADALADGLPGRPAVWRTGGDSFACALPGAAPEEALLGLDAVRRALASRRHPVGGKRIALTVSGGIASFPQHVEDPAELLDAAGAALHRAKSEGRDRIAIYVEEKMVLKSNYYPRAQLAALAALAQARGTTEAALLREALARLLDAHREEI